MKPRDSERRLLDLVRTRNPTAFVEIVESYSACLYAVLMRMVGARGIAEDLLQDTFIQVYTHLSQFRGEASLYTWIYRIAVNLALRWLRRRQAPIQWESFDETSVRPLLPRHSPLDPQVRIQNREMLEQLEQAIARLSEANRTVFILREIEGMDFSEIAEVLGCSQEAVRTRLCRAKKDLKQLLRPYLELQDVRP